jgi:sugar O-acyltransferase (sialic acid O-acetyltransferase NeuD family)
MIDVHIIGSGGLAKELISYIVDEAQPRYNIVGVWGDDPFNNARYMDYYRGTVKDAAEHLNGESAFLGIASPRGKCSVVEQLATKVKWISYSHPSAIVSSMASIGKGVVITPLVIVTSDAVIKDYVFINTGGVVGHDSIVDEYTTLFPNTEVCGDCVVGKSVIIGIGANIIPGVVLPDNTKVRAGSVVWKSPERSGTLSGNPAILVK